MCFKLVRLSLVFIRLPTFCRHYNGKKARPTTKRSIKCVVAKKRRFPRRTKRVFVNTCLFDYICISDAYEQKRLENIFLTKSDVCLSAWIFLDECKENVVDFGKERLTILHEIKLLLKCKSTYPVTLLILPQLNSVQTDAVPDFHSIPSWLYIDLEITVRTFGRINKKAL